MTSNKLTLLFTLFLCNIQKAAKSYHVSRMNELNCTGVLVIQSVSTDLCMDGLSVRLHVSLCHLGWCVGVCARICISP